MAKRSKDTLTGGTGDVNPEYSSIGLVLTAGAGGSAIATAPIVLPVLPSSNSNQSTAQVVEILKVYLDFGPFPQLTATLVDLTNTIRLAFNSATAGLAVTSNSDSISNPLMLYQESVELQGNLSAAGTGPVAYARYHNKEVDLTDGAGHGVLVAVPTLWFGAAIAGWPVGGQAGLGARVLYRLKKVTLVEYIGIVQQQSGPQI